MLVDYDKTRDTLVVRDVPLRLTDVMHRIMGARHVRNTDDWTIPATWSSFWQLTEDVDKRAFTFSPSCIEWNQGAYADVLRMHALQIAKDEPGNESLLSLQRVGVRFLLEGRRRILGDDMGSGKTVMACDALAQIPQQTILIACPKTLISVWERHVQVWCKDITPVVASDSAVKRRKAIEEAERLVGLGRRVALIMNYESAWRHTRLSPYGNLRMERCEECDPNGADPVASSKCEVHAKELNTLRWDVVICDEAHRIINISKQTRGLWYLTKDAQYVWALTGTPSRGNIADFWSLLRLVDPDSWPSRTKFVDRYCVSSSDNWGNLQVHGLRADKKDEFEQVTSQYMLRRMFEQIMRGWAESNGEEHVSTRIISEQRYVELTKEQRRMYTELADSIFATTPDGHTVFADNALEELTRLLQVSSASLTTEELQDGTHRVKMVKPSPKVDELLEVIRDVGQNPVVVFAVNRDLIILAAEALMSAGYACSVVHGLVDPGDRTTEIERFQEGQTQVFLGTYASASEGVTLTRSHIMVRMQLSWSMIMNKQADGRINRYGQGSKELLYVDLIAQDTVESRVHEAYGDKLSALEAIVQDAKRMRELI